MARKEEGRNGWRKSGRVGLFLSQPAAPRWEKAFVGFGRPRLCGAGPCSATITGLARRPVGVEAQAWKVLDFNQKAHQAHHPTKR